MASVPGNARFEKTQITLKMNATDFGSGPYAVPASCPLLQKRAFAESAGGKWPHDCCGRVKSTCRFLPHPSGRKMLQRLSSSSLTETAGLPGRWPAPAPTDPDVRN